MYFRLARRFICLHGGPPSGSSRGHPIILLASIRYSDEVWQIVSQNIQGLRDGINDYFDQDHGQPSMPSAVIEEPHDDTHNETLSMNTDAVTHGTAPASPTPIPDVMIPTTAANGFTTEQLASAIELQ